MRFGPTPFAELEDLRGLNERRELEPAKRALEAEVLQKDFLLKEVNHRIKNGLQIVSSILHLQCDHTENEEAIKARCKMQARALLRSLRCTRGFIPEAISGLSPLVRSSPPSAVTSQTL
jgi:hypothetical protein